MHSTAVTSTSWGEHCSRWRYWASFLWKAKLLREEEGEEEVTTWIRNSRLTLKVQKEGEQVLIQLWGEYFDHECFAFSLALKWGREYSKILMPRELMRRSISTMYHLPIHHIINNNVISYPSSSKVIFLRLRSQNYLLSWFFSAVNLHPPSTKLALRLGFISLSAH